MSQSPEIYARHPAALAPVVAEPAPSLGDEIRNAVSVLVEGWWLLAIFIVAAATLAVAYIAATPPLYSARTELLFDPRQKQVVTGSVVETGLAANAVSAQALFVDSQMRIIQSEATARKLINREGLADDPEFAGEPSVLGELRRLAGGLLRSLASRPTTPGSGYDKVLEKVEDRLDVGRDPNTYVISIDFKSRDPEKAARLANAVAEIYLAESSGADSASTEEAAHALDTRLEALRIAANRDAAAVEQYRREHGLTDTDNMLVVEQQLHDLNDQLALARVATSDAEASLEQVRSALDTTDVAGVADLDIGALESEVLNRLQVMLTSVEADEARLRAQLLPGHPDLVAATERKAAVRAAIESEFRRLASRLERKFEVARERQARIEKQVEDLKAEAAQSDLASVKLHELQRAADASQSVYATFLNRSKEIWEQVGLPNETARVFSRAFAPSRPSEPRPLLLIAAALVIGTLVGLVVVWLRHVLTDPGTSRRVVAGADILPVRESFWVDGQEWVARIHRAASGGPSSTPPRDFPFAGHPEGQRWT